MYGSLETYLSLYITTLYTLLAVQSVPLSVCV